MAFLPSIQQTAALNFGVSDTRSLNLVARAGCGKTSTLLLLVIKLLESFPSCSIYLGAYNAAIAKDISKKLAALGIEDWKQLDGRWIAPKAAAGTMHSAGLRGWKKFAPKSVIDKEKVAKIIAKFYEAANQDQKDSIDLMRAFVLKAVSLAKQRAFGVLNYVDDRSKWFDMIDHFSLDEDLPEDFDLNVAVKFSIWVYRRSLEACQETIDYDDMILAPLYFPCRLWQHDFVMIDEAQDTNSARRALAKKMLKPGTGRLIAVGDPAQAIYGFTGADSDSMDIIRYEMNSAELPLNVTYRCAKSIVRLAQTWVPDIMADESAPEGIVRNLIYNAPKTEKGDKIGTDFWDESLTKDDIVLCRNTKPLVELAYSLIRKGIACQVEGREIAAGLTRVIRKWKVKGLKALDNALDAYRVREVAKWLAKGKEDKAQRIDDQCETIRVLSDRLQGEGKTDVESLVQFIDSLFGKFDDDPNVKPPVLTLCTIHKSKGREWRRVYLLGRNKFQPSKYARVAWQQEQERNLMYVAVTRAMNELVEVIV